MILFRGEGRSPILFVALAFSLVCFCPGVIQGDDNQSCSCTGGCALNQTCESASTCYNNKENVAYGKNANISSRYSANGQMTGPACAAVNGRTSDVMKFENENGTNCVHTTDADNKASWTVDLGRNYTIKDIVIYSRKNQAKRLAGIWIYVDNAICKTFPGNSGSYDIIHTAVCESPKSGQFVKFSKEVTVTIDQGKFINFCEVQIWVCKHPFFGDQCDRTCHCKTGTLCDNYYGTCPSGCVDGYYGETCSTKCGNCQSGIVCDDGSGHCRGGCETGYQPPFCNVTCPNKTYGDNCTENCGQCDDGAACNVFNGTCTICKGNFAPPYCKECLEDYYGITTCSACGQCADNTICDKSNGHCPKGCEAGYVQPLCQDTCQDRTYGVNCTENCGKCQDGAACNVFNGTCLTCEGNFSMPLCQVCKDGFNGDTCTEECGQCKADTVCGKANGHCPEGCMAGYSPPLCKDTCQNKTYGNNCAESCGQCGNGNICDIFNGTCPTCEKNFKSPLCKVCVPGFYGDACTGECGNCTEGVDCDARDGHCPGGCNTGFEPPLCKDKCANQTYGDNCKESCGNCKGGIACDSFNGACLTCEDGFSPPLCTAKLTEETPFDPTGAAVGGAVAAVVVVIAAVAGIFLIRRRRSRKDSSNSSNRTSQSENGTDPSERPLNFLPITGVKDTSTSAKSSNKPTSHVKPFSQAKKPKPSNETTAQQRQQNQREHVYANDPSTSSATAPPPPTGPAPPSKVSGKAAPKPGAEMETPFLDDDNESDDALYGNIGNMYSALKSSRQELDGVQKYLVGRLASEGLRGEFQTFSKINEDEPISAGSLKANLKKNRYAGIVPYDRNRVILDDGYNEGTSDDYINASYISGYDRERKYIAAQGPKDNTAGDFWRMVWQEKVTHIVMLTNLQEQGRGKCQLYWSTEDGATTTSFPPITVTITKEERRDHFFTRTLTITRADTKGSREVTQYHYVSWPDHGVPSTVSLARFWRHVTNSARDSLAPLLVHCSAGVGRTGTFIGLDLGMEIAVHEGQIDVHDLVKRLRAERTLMVQAMDQYVCLYEVLLEAYTARDTCLPLDQLDVVFPEPLTSACENKRIDTEFKALMEMQPLCSQYTYAQAVQDENVGKNRNPSVLPADDHVVYLMQHEPGRNQYINAVFMPTFRDPRGSILTQLPLPSTLVDFWRMAYGSDITTIVSLCSPGEKEKVTPYCQYWPLSTREPVKSGAYTVSLQQQQTILQNLTSYSLTLLKSGADDDKRSLQLLHYVGWDGLVDVDVSDLLQVIESVSKSLADTRQPKLVIQCCDGVSKSGLFSALCDVINSMTYDRELDVYLAVRHVQTVAPSAVSSLAQYRYIFHVAQQRYRDMSIYANN